MTKTVPSGSSIQLLVGSVVAQSAPISAGTYRITIERLDGSLPRRSIRRGGHR